MSLLTFTQEKTFIKILGLALVCTFFSEAAVADWEIDLSRRRRQTQKSTETAGQQTAAEQTLSFVDKIIPSQGYSQDIVVLNTDKGFLPATLHLKRGGKYTIHVVNVNDKEKNTSFIMDAFKESHATYFGQIKSFTINPDKDGIYNFQCPETSVEGRVVIYSDDKKSRALAGDKE